MSALFLEATGALIAVGSPTNAEALFLRGRKVSKSSIHVPIGSRRHASPSGPWPWVDLDDEFDLEQKLESATSAPCPGHDSASCNNCWTGYPQSLFPHWTDVQVAKSKIQETLTAYNREKQCILYCVDLNSNRCFSRVDAVVASYGKEQEVWQTLVNEERPPNPRPRVRCLFVENLSGPILQMLGTKYNIPPSYWSCALNWISSYFQTDVQPQIGDKVTITLKFLKISSDIRFTTEDGINTRAPLLLDSAGELRYLVQDLLSVVLTCNISGSTIISYHPALELSPTTASFLHDRICFAGQSIHWQTIFQKSSDPTFILLIFIWHGLYAWDEAEEDLYDHICFLEAHTLLISDMRLAYELRLICAHLVSYIFFLEDYTQCVKFIKERRNPMLDNPRFTDYDRAYSRETMQTECDNLLLEIERLKNHLQIQQRRLTNVINLTFNSVQIANSKCMRETAKAVTNSDHTIRQLSYVLMIFIPTSFAASIFRMKEFATFPTLGLFFAIALPLSVVTAWIVIKTSRQQA